MLPNDPIMLLSYLNTQLRDNYKDLEELCDRLDADRSDIEEKLGKIGYVYNKELNQFK